MNAKCSPVRIGIIALLLAALACNLPASAAEKTPEDVSAAVTLTLAAMQTSPLASTDAPPASTEIPAATSTAGVLHIAFPADIQTNGALNYDVDSRGTAPEHRAPYGDSYKLNRFERPFTQNVMDFLPDVDIQTFRISADPTWYYVFIELAGPNPASGLTANYGVEIDYDRDGHGDYLIWAAPPFASSWTTDGVTVYMDTNNDTGGISPERSDAPFNGNGYDQVMIASGRNGLDPDLAWVRIDPRSSTTVQFAFKKSLVGSSFLWGVWADLGLRDPTRFSYNDYFTEDQAGSPEKSETQFYPIKAVYAVDNTCRAANGFKPTGYEPLICPVDQPQTPKPHNTPHVCQQPPYCVPPGWIWHQDTCTCEEVPF